MKITIPIKTQSEANLREHWGRKAKRAKRQRQVTAMVLQSLPEALGSWKALVITLIRVAPRRLDTDNLAISLKSIRDSVADVLVPGLKPGRADDDERITWKYDQQKGGVREYEVIVDIEVTP